MTVFEIIRTTLEAVCTVMIIVGFFNEEKIVKWERKRFFPAVCKIKKSVIRKICVLLKSNTKFMTWLNKPSATLSQRIENSFPPVGVTVYNDWRKQYDKTKKIELYEKKKCELRNLDLSPKEYEQKIKEFCDRIKL